jgi:hypothetical protein
MSQLGLSMYNLAVPVPYSGGRLADHERMNVTDSNGGLAPPLQCLLIAQDWGMRIGVLDGGKSISIRTGYRDYRLGPMMIADHKEPFAVMVNVTSVRHCKLMDVTEEEMEADGFGSHDHMVRRLRRFYPDIRLDSPVTVIQWDQPTEESFLARARSRIMYRYQRRKLYSEMVPD